MKTFIWMILEMMIIVFGIFAFGINAELVLALVTVAIIILAVLYFVGTQVADRSKFFQKFVNLFAD